MFKNNKYTKIYYALIENRRNLGITGYSERHHIIPRCLGGNDLSDNIIRLNAREHFIAHLLLTKMHDSFKIKLAFHMMSIVNHNQKRNYRITSHIYDYIKKCNSIASKERNLEFHHRPTLNKIRYNNPITLEEIFIDKDTPIPNGFIKGMGKKTKDIMIGKNKGKK